MGVAKYVKNEKDAIEEVIYQSGIRVKPVYTPQDLDEIGFDYEKDLDHTSIHRIRYPPGNQQALQTNDIPWTDRLKCGVRSSHADGL
jgi:hypothetical protein